MMNSYVYILLLSFFGLYLSNQNYSCSSEVYSKQQNTIGNYLKNQPITQLPFSVADYLFDSLDGNEIQYEKELQYLNYFSKEKMLQLSDSTLLSLQLDSASHQKFTILNHYLFLTSYDCSCHFSKPYFFRCLPNLKNGTEVFLTLTKIIEEKDRIRGIVITLNLYDTTKNIILDRLHLMTAGIGGEDITYYDAFNIGKDFNIRTYSSFYIEDEFTEIIRKFNFGKKNNIIEYERMDKSVYYFTDED